jgi:hypothetical protein
VSGGKGLAGEPGWKYGQILRHYFPDLSIIERQAAGH